MAVKKYLVDLDLTKNQLLNAVVQNLTTHPSSPREGQIYTNTSDDKMYGYLGGEWVDLSHIYTHPTHSALNPTLTGNNVLAVLEVDAEGHVTKAQTRTLSLSDLGFTGDSDANNYTHPTFSGNSFGPALTDLDVISEVVVNNEGHVTGFSTRTLQASDLAAAVVNDSITSGTYTWSSQKIQQELNEINSTIAGALVYKGGYQATANIPNLTSPASGEVEQGFTYTVTEAGDFHGEGVQVGDMIIAEVNDPSSLSDWTLVNKNIPDIVDASTTDKGIIRIATQSEVNAGTSNNTAVTPSTLVSYVNAHFENGKYATDIGDGTATSFDITHGLGTTDVFVSTYYNGSDKDEVSTLVRVVDNNKIRILVNKALDNNEIRVVIRN